MITKHQMKDTFSLLPRCKLQQHLSQRSELPSQYSSHLRADQVFISAWQVIRPVKFPQTTPAKSFCDSILFLVGWQMCKKERTSLPGDSEPRVYPLPKLKAS